MSISSACLYVSIRVYFACLFFLGACLFVSIVACIFLCVLLQCVSAPFVLFRQVFLTAIDSFSIAMFCLLNILLQQLNVFLGVSLFISTNFIEGSHYRHFSTLFYVSAEHLLGSFNVWRIGFRCSRHVGCFAMALHCLLHFGNICCDFVVTGN